MKKPQENTWRICPKSYLYKDFADREHDPIIKAIIEAKKSVVMSDMGLLSAQFEIQYNIAKINLRLEELEKSYSRN